MTWWLWIITGVVLLIVIWYVALTFSLRSSFARSEPALNLELAVDAPRELRLKVIPALEIKQLVVESISINRQAAHDLRLGPPPDFIEERLELSAPQDLEPDQRAKRQREIDELNRRFVYFRGKLKIAGGTTQVLVFPGVGSSSVPVEVSVTYSRRVGVVGETSFKSVSMPVVALDG